MFSKFQLFAVACAFALFGCAQMAGSQGTRALCQSAVCKVDVAVVDCASGDIRAIPDTIEISKEHRNVQIHWDLDRDAIKAGFTFTDRGIQVRDNDGQITDPQRAEQGRKFLWKNKNDNTKTYKYAIALQRDGTACQLKDPFIDNGR